MIKKSYFYSGILSILLVCLILTIFEIVFFYVIAKPEITNNINKISRNSSKKLKKILGDNDNITCQNLKKNKNLNLIKKNIIAMFFEYERSMKQNNKNIIINIVFIIVLLIIFILYVVEILFLKSEIKEATTRKIIDWSFIPSTCITIFLIILFQIHFYFNVSKNYNFVSSQELIQIIKKRINKKYYDNLKAQNN